jgi:hypothetical protein
MNLFNRNNVTVGIAALMVAATVALSSPALADSTPVNVPYMVGVNTTTNLYDAPNLNADYIGQVLAGQTWFVLGEDTTGKWTEIQITPTIVGWGATSAFALNGITLPIIAGVTGGTTVTVPADLPTVSANPPYVVAAGSSVLVQITATTNVFDHPNANVVGQVTAGQTWFAVGKDSTGKWVQLQIDPTNFDWVVASAVGLGNIQLPVVAS